MFLLVQEKISPIALNNPSAGGFAYFEGRIRDHNYGKQVIQLEYEAFEPLALSEGYLILQEAEARFNVLNVQAIHRTGPVPIGETAVWIGVCAAHRDAAFEACQYIIDEIKKRLPIWKKETYADGTEEWVQCCHSTDVQFELSPDEMHYYAQQIHLPALGTSGQFALKQARVLVVGAGGLGSSALMYLARAGIGTLGICEFDKVAADNLPRQILYEALDIGKSKGEQAQKRLSKMNPYIRIHHYPERLNRDNVPHLLAQYDWVLDCTDHPETHLLLSQAAVKFKKVLIQASIYQYEGQLAVYHPEGNSACLCDLWNKPQSVYGSCQALGVLGTTPGILGALQATETIKSILEIPSPLNNHLLLFDLTDYRLLQIRRHQEQACSICGDGDLLMPVERSVTGNFPVIELAQVKNFEPYKVISIGVPQSEVASLGCLNTRNWQPWVEDWLPECQESHYLVLCPFGRRSLQLAIRLRGQGFSNVFSLQGGMSALYQNVARGESVLR